MQSTVATSTAEAEVVALIAPTQELIFLGELGAELGMSNHYRVLSPLTIRLV